MRWRPTGVDGGSTEASDREGERPIPIQLVLLKEYPVRRVSFLTLMDLADTCHFTGGSSGGESGGGAPSDAGGTSGWLQNQTWIRTQIWLRSQAAAVLLPEASVRFVHSAL